MTFQAAYNDVVVGYIDIRERDSLVFACLVFAIAASIAFAQECVQPTVYITNHGKVCLLVQRSRTQPVTVLGQPKFFEVYKHGLDI